MRERAVQSPHPFLKCRKGGLHAFAASMKAGQRIPPLAAKGDFSFHSTLSGSGCCSSGRACARRESAVRTKARRRPEAFSREVPKSLGSGQTFSTRKSSTRRRLYARRRPDPSYSTSENKFHTRSYWQDLPKGCCSSGRACELCRRDLRIFLVRNRKASCLARPQGPSRATVLTPAFSRVDPRRDHASLL